MGEKPVPSVSRPSNFQLVVVVALTFYFAFKAVRWWAGVSTGATAIDAMTTWEWVKVGFYHVAIVAGVAGTIEMLRARSRPEAESAPDDRLPSPPPGPGS